MKAQLGIVLFSIFACTAGAQSSGSASKHIGDAFKTSLTNLRPVPEKDRAAVIAFAKPVLENLVTFRDDGTATTIHRLGKGETHIEWRGLRLSSVRAGLVTDADRANGISRKFSVGLASDTHRTWDRTTSRWGDWRSSGYLLFPSSLQIQERNGRLELANKFNGTFGRGPIPPAAAPATDASPAPNRHPWKQRTLPPGIRRID